MEVPPGNGRFERPFAFQPTGTVLLPLPGTSIGFSPHFSPGGVIMAQEFFPQRVLASEERSGHYGRASMCALRGKGQARARPAPCVTARHHNRTDKLLKNKLPFIIYRATR